MDLQKLYAYTRKAIEDYKLIDEGDHIAVGISGGKDSLTLLYAMAGIQKFYPKHFELSAVTVDLGFPGFYESLDPIRELCDKLSVHYEVVRTDIARIVFEARQENNPCALCATLRKGALNRAIKKMGCNKVAYAHHRDDLIDTLMMSIIYEGRIHTFTPKTYLDRMEISVIRPMLYVPEMDVIGFRNKYELPVVVNPCPEDGESKRTYINDLVRRIEKENPGSKQRIFHSILKTGFVFDDDRLPTDPPEK